MKKLDLLQRVEARREKAINEFVNPRIERFDNINSIDSDTKSRIRDSIISYHKILARYLYPKFYYVEGYNILRIPLFMFALLTILAFLILFLYFFQEISNYISHPNTAFIFVVFVFATIPYIVTRIIAYLSTFIYRKRVFYKVPISLTIDRLLFVIRSVEQTKDIWRGLRFKTVLIKSIEEIAGCLEYALPRRLRSGDVITDIWLEDMTKQVATALREKKMWILTPRKDTRDYLLRSLVSTLVCIVEGNWDDLERVEPKKLPRPAVRSVIVNLLFKTLKTSFWAVLPAMAFIGFQLTPLATTGALRGYITVGLIVWFVLTFVVAFDPNFSAKFSALKDMKSLLSPTGVDPKL